jgi:hypothetical protein
LAVQFQSHADTTHYGWIRYQAETTTSDLVVGKITGWAYESTPDQPILAAAVPEPSAGLLVLFGVLTIGLRRQRRKA